MPGAVPDRARWAVELLDPAPDDEVLEVGSGPGVAVALVAERLRRGRVTALDRSATAITRARARNADHVASGRVVLHQVELSAFTPAAGSFDTAFAVNVNVFWTTAADAECEVLRRALRPEGVVRLVYDAPSPRRAADLATAVAANLRRHGFRTEVTAGPGDALVCITGR